VLPGNIIFMTSAVSGPPRFWRIREISPEGAGGGLLPIGNALCCSGPALSPDGTELAFTGEGIMSVTDLKGHPANGRWSQDPVTSALGYFQDPVWSPSGKQIAFLAVPGGPQGPEIDVINADGTGLRRVIQGSEIETDTQAGVTPGTLAWSPDGTRIAFATTPAGTAVPSGTIVVVGVSGGPAHTIVSGVLGGVTGLTWAPGPQPLFTSGHDPGIWEADGRGGAKIVLQCGTCRDSDPSWAPDGVHFAAVRHGQGIIVAAVQAGVQAIIGPPDVTYVQWGGPAGPPSPSVPSSSPSP
jgi:Tol biopolymer transport system component